MLQPNVNGKKIRQRKIKPDKKTKVGKRNYLKKRGMKIGGKV